MFNGAALPAETFIL